MKDGSTPSHLTQHREDYRRCIRLNHISVYPVFSLTCFPSCLLCAHRSWRARCLSYGPFCRWWSSTDWTCRRWPPCAWSSSTCQSSWQPFRKRSARTTTKSFSSGFCCWKPGCTAAWTNWVCNKKEETLLITHQYTAKYHWRRLVVVFSTWSSRISKWCCEKQPLLKFIAAAVNLSLKFCCHGPTGGEFYWSEQIEKVSYDELWCFSLPFQLLSLFCRIYMWIDFRNCWWNWVEAAGD